MYVYEYVHGCDFSVIARTHTMVSCVYVCLCVQMHVNEVDSKNDNTINAMLNNNEHTHRLAMLHNVDVLFLSLLHPRQRYPPSCHSTQTLQLYIILCKRMRACVYVCMRVCVMFSSVHYFI